MGEYHKSHETLETNSRSQLRISRIVRIYGRRKGRGAANGGAQGCPGLPKATSRPLGESGRVSLSSDLDSPVPASEGAGTRPSRSILRVIRVTTPARVAGS